MSVFPQAAAAGAAIAPTQPQQAYLSASVTTEGWQELLNYSSGGGFLRRVVARGHTGAATAAIRRNIEARISVDGQAAVLLESTGSSHILRSISSGPDDDDINIHHFLGIRFESSVLIEVQRVSGFTSLFLQALVDYSTDLS